MTEPKRDSASGVLLLSGGRMTGPLILPDGQQAVSQKQMVDTIAVAVGMDPQALLLRAPAQPTATTWRQTMTFLYALNWIVVLIGSVHVTCMLARYRHLSWADFKALPWPERTLAAAWRFGCALLGGAFVAILIGPLWGYTEPAWPAVLTDVGAVMALIALHFSKSNEGTLTS